MSRYDTVPIRIDDPNCRGVTSRDGRVQYNKDARGRVYVPRHEADAILASGMRDAHRGELQVHLGSSGVADLQAAYDAYCATLASTDPWIPYATWYRTIYRKEIS